jgi:hypothetical protein
VPKLLDMKAYRSVEATFKNYDPQYQVDVSGQFHASADFSLGIEPYCTHSIRVGPRRVLNPVLLEFVMSAVVF